jgi:hypothetical protein
MLEYIGNGKPGFYFLDIHVEKIISSFKGANIVTKGI